MYRPQPGLGANAGDLSDVHRRGESSYVRSLLRAWAPIAHCILCITLSISVVLLDGKRLKPGERRFSETFRGDLDLRASDVTTIVSTALVIARIVGQSFMMGVAWRGAIVLLQHDGLSLSQLKNMVTYRIPTSLSGKHARSIGLALMLLLPLTVISPLLSGSVDWVAGNAYGSTEVSSIRGGFGLRHSTAEHWYYVRNYPFSRQGTVFVALGFAAQAWPSGGLNTSDGGWHRYVAWREAELYTMVQHVPMPFIGVHSISWDSKIEYWVEDILHEPTSALHTTNAFGLDRGNSLFFKVKNATFPDCDQPARVITDTWKAAVLVGKYPQDNCLSMATKRWNGFSESRTAFYFNARTGCCWAIATVKFTVGIRYFESGKYVSNRTVEALRDKRGSSPRVVGDQWAECAIHMLADMMACLPMMQKGNVAFGKRNLTAYTERLIRQSYPSVRGALYPYSPVPAHLNSRRPVQYLQAQVDRVRVLVWLVLNLLLPVSALLMFWVEKASEGSGRRRNPVLDPALALLLTDVRDILGEDANGISNMSYLTKSDTQSIGKLRLGPINIPSSHAGVVFAVTKERKHVSRGRETEGEPGT